jgi:flagellar basal-body rod protein FlgB
MTQMTPSPPLLSTLENYLKLTTSRELAISANMANVDTPGYHTRDINFEGELNKAIGRSLSGTEAGSEGVQLNPVVQEVPGLMERPDGNNVSLDREGLLLSETQLQYQMGIQLIKHHFHGLLSAISGGN